MDVKRPSNDISSFAESEFQHGAVLPLPYVQKDSLKDSTDEWMEVAEFSKHQGLRV